MNVRLAEALMRDFARLTGIEGSAPPRRYLWTDAFAVCNFLGFARQTGNAEYLAFAKAMVAQVHQMLGRHREDDARRGWISGLAEAEGERHPTRGGLRIGKPLPERRADEPPDPRLEWERDGQYFHYLSKWMHALHRMHRETGERCYHDWAVELALVAHRSFTCEMRPGGAKRMVWKMSVDLSRPLVASMGQHDPLDGLVSCLELQSANNECSAGLDALRVTAEDYARMCRSASWGTDDPLGVGGLLDAAARLAQLPAHIEPAYHEILCAILQASEASLPAMERAFQIGLGQRSRLAFRELGLSIGLHAVRQVVASGALNGDVAVLFQRLLRFEPLATRIEDWWSEPGHRTTRAWTEHADINNVMLATSLAPDGFLAV